MAISLNDKVDFVFKKLVYGVTKTAADTAKFGSNETIASPLPVYANNIWAQAGSIPALPSASSADPVTNHTGASRLRLTNDVTSAPNIAWLATATHGDPATRLGDFIPPTFGTGYAPKVYIGDPDAGPAARLYPDATGEEWVFDPNAGTLYFPNAVPGSKTATVGSGSVSVGANGLYLEAYRYTGVKGVAAAGSTSKTHVVPTIAQRDALNGVNAGDMVYVTDASGIATDAGPGEYAVYLYTGSGYALVATQDSARTDSRTQSVTVAAGADPVVALSRVGNGARVVSVSVEVTEAFDGGFALSVGDAGDNARLMDGLENDPSVAGFYVTTPTQQYPGGAETAVSIFTSGTATVGSALVTLTYA